KFYLDVNPQADAVACDYLLLDDHEQIIDRGNCDEKPIACGIMFRKQRLFDIGLYDEDDRDFGAIEGSGIHIRFTPTKPLR
uniref:hypothetical protein n=1 Tax=Rheinheimera sp. TaxID=1869214 RepID=UPI0040480A9D